ncbi:hypothetical protein CS542_07120 [Pedobacter sp. IW39]|nr:hypothetical protein CS542_07120 [Pedobacter sp. IW39]
MFGIRTRYYSYEKGYQENLLKNISIQVLEALKKNSWVDGTKIGIQGQLGWLPGCTLITATNMYAAWAVRLWLLTSAWRYPLDLE